MKHRVSKYAVCPYYKHEDTQVIYCLGLADENVIHLAFADATTAKEYKYCFCRKEYKSCDIYRMLENIYK
jgi:hypothetical protein